MKPKQFIFRVISVLLILLLGSACSPSLPQSAQQANSPEPTVAATPVPLDGAKSTSPASPADETPTTAADMSGMGGSTAEVPSTGQASLLKVSDQSLENDMLKVEDVFSNGPGWVVVYTLSASGQPDQPIGHAPVKDGDNPGVMVQVDPAKAQGTLLAMLHMDKGKPGTFEFPEPDAPLMEGVRMISGTFKILPPGASNAPITEVSPEVTKSGTTPAIIVANQPIVQNQVILPEVISDSEAWVVIHKQNGDGSMGPMVGFAKVQSGVNKNVAIPLDTSLTSTIMYAMLHQNVAKKTSPQFPGADIPIMINGKMINPTFEITSSKNADVVLNLGNTPETVSYLVDGAQMSLYISLQDGPGKSNCTNECLATWHPLYATGRIIAGTGISQSKVGILLLPGGERQVTYLGAPLYLYSKDEKPGDVNGQGLDGSWYLVTP